MPDERATAAERLRFAADVVVQVIDGEALVLKLGDETAFALNGTGTRIAELIGAGVALQALIDRLAREFDATRDLVERDVTMLVDELIARGLLVVMSGHSTLTTHNS